MLPAGTNCVDLNRAIHELGHIIGFDHTTDPSDIMYPYESCARQITKKEIMTIESIYSMEPRPQLYLSGVSVLVDRGYANINFSVKNIGIIHTPKTEIFVYSDGKVAYKIELDILRPSDGVFEYLKNIRMASGSKSIGIIADPESKIDQWYRNLTYVNLSLGG